MNRNDALRISVALLIPCSVTIYLTQARRIRDLKKQLLKTATLGLLTAHVLRHAVEGMTEEQAEEWLKNLETELTFQNIVNQH